VIEALRLYKTSPMLQGGGGAGIRAFPRGPWTIAKFLLKAVCPETEGHNISISNRGDYWFCCLDMHTELEFDWGDPITVGKYKLIPGVLKSGPETGTQGNPGGDAEDAQPGSPDTATDDG